MHRGFIKLYRKTGDNSLWTAEKFTRGQAWVDLIMLTNYKDGHIRKRGMKVAVKRGVCGWSMLALADRWKWSRGKVQRFLDELETEQQIEQQKNRVTTLIKIINYDQYQDNGTTNKTTNGQQTDNKRTTNGHKQEYKERKEIKRDITRAREDGEASALYEKYLDLIDPAQKTRARATGNITHFLKTYHPDDLLVAIENYSTIAIGRDKKYRKNPANFFGKQEKFFIDFLPGKFAPPGKNSKDAPQPKSRAPSAFERSRNSALNQARMLKAIREKEQHEQKQDLSSNPKRVRSIEYDPTNSD